MNARTRSETFPFVFGLLPNKCKTTYTTFFRELRKIGEPETIIIGFEIAVLNVLTEIFPNPKIRGCWFHFNQNIFRKAQELGLQNMYQSDKEFCKQLKLFSCLAFVPPRDVQRRFGQVVKLVHHDLLPVARYFEDVYVGNNFTEPLFPLNFWNVHERVKNGVPKTSNFVEGFHSRLNKIIRGKRPPIWKFLSSLRQIPTSTSSDFVSAACWHTDRKSVV